MNRDIIYQTELFGGEEPPVWSILLLCLLINGWAAVTANFLAKGWARDIQEMERWNTFYFKGNADILTDRQENDLIHERNKARWYAIISAAVLFSIVGLIIWHRWEVVNETAAISIENGEQVPGLLSTTIVIIALPLAILIGELITGDYVWYLMQRAIIKFKRWRNYRSFLKHKRACAQLDKQAYDYVQTAQKQPGTLELGAELEKSLFRVRFRALDQDDYMDPVANLHRISFVLNDKISGAPAARMPIFGVLPNGVKTGDFITDDQGRVTMSWTSNFDRLELVTIREHSYPGPFLENSEHLILIIHL